MGKALLIAALLLAAARPAVAQEPPPAAGEAAVQAPGEAAVQAPGEPGPLVTAIEVRSETPIENPRDLEQMLAIEVGKALDDEQVRRTLRNVQASGLASQIEIYTRPAAPGPGVVAVLVLRPQVRVAAVRIDGELGLRQAELARVIPQKEAEPLSEERVLRGVYALQRLYREQRLLRARGALDVAVDLESRQAVVTYEVDSGPRARVRQIDFEGRDRAFCAAAAPPAAPGEARRALRAAPGARGRRAAPALADPARPPARRGGGAGLRPPARRGRGRGARGAHPRGLRLRPGGEDRGPELSHRGRPAPRARGRWGPTQEAPRRRACCRSSATPATTRPWSSRPRSASSTCYQRQGHYKVEVELEQQRLEPVLRVAIAASTPAPSTRCARSTSPATRRSPTSSSPSSW